MKVKGKKVNEPKRVRLLKDYVDIPTGIQLPKGTVLERTCSGQYVVPGTGLGKGGAIAFYGLIREISLILVK